LQFAFFVFPLGDGYTVSVGRLLSAGHSLAELSLVFDHPGANGLESSPAFQQHPQPLE
jgi:hypothetical protein